MTQINHADSHRLLTQFFQECESQFRFLEEQYGYLYFSGLVGHKNHCRIVTPYKNITLDPDKPFHAVTRYERGQQAIEVLYGDKNYGLDVFVYPDCVKRLGLNDLIAATKGHTSSLQNFSALDQPNDLSHALKSLAETMRDHPTILSPSADLSNRAADLRDTLLEQTIRAHHEKNSNSNHGIIS